MKGALGVAAIFAALVGCWLVGTATAQTGGIEPTDADLRQAISHQRQTTARVLDRKCLPNPYRPYQYKRVATIPAGRLKPIERTWGRRLHAAYRVHTGCNDARRIIRMVFGPTSPAAISVAYCESKLSPRARNPYSGAAGLFQLMPLHWRGKFDPYNPTRNSRYAYRLSRRGYDWSHWVCKP